MFVTISGTVFSASDGLERIRRAAVISRGCARSAVCSVPERYNSALPGDPVCGVALDCRRRSAGSISSSAGSSVRTESDKQRYQQAIHFVTHEMRSPLTAIQGSSELMGRYALTEEKRKQMAQMIN